jgi:flagellar biogenesis protein FliO
MTDTVWRLIWALPLVLVTGTAAMLVLKRILTPVSPPVEPGRHMALRESLTVSDGTRMHLIEVNRQNYLLVESATNTVLQCLQPQADLSRQRPVSGPPWAQRLARGLLR